MKMKVYGSFEAWKRDQSAANRRLITALAALVTKAAPEFTRGVKWGQGCWMLGDTPKVYIHAEPDHVQCGFYSGARLNDPASVLEGRGKHVRFVRVFRVEDIPRQALTALVAQVR
jgi:hypothetical protein